MVLAHKRTWKQGAWKIHSFFSCESVSLLRDEFVSWVGAGTGSRIFIFRLPPFFGISEPHVLKADVLLQVTYLGVE